MNRYIIDGNNLVHKVPHLKMLAAGSMAAAAESLQLLLFEFIRKYPSYKITLVFDGFQKSLNLTPAIRVVNSGRAKIADSIIKAIIREQDACANIYVVSSDNEIYNYARLHACNVLLSEEFAGQILNIVENLPPEKPSRSSGAEKAELLQLFSAELRPDELPDAVKAHIKTARKKAGKGKKGE